MHHCRRAVDDGHWLPSAVMLTCQLAAAVTTAFLTTTLLSLVDVFVRTTDIAAEHEWMIRLMKVFISVWSKNSLVLHTRELKEDHDNSRQSEQTTFSDSTRFDISICLDNFTTNTKTTCDVCVCNLYWSLSNVVIFSIVNRTNLSSHSLQCDAFMQVLTSIGYANFARCHRHIHISPKQPNS